MINKIKGCEIHNIRKKFLVIMFVLMYTFTSFEACNINIYATSEVSTTEENVESEEISIPSTADNVGTITGEHLAIQGEAVILIEQSTGKILYAKNPHQIIYPASLTKILTAMVLLDYFDKDELVECGDEIHEVPSDSSKSGHVEGEFLTVENLVRSLIILSGNDTSCVAARDVAARETQNDNISYDNARVIFATLLNEKAKEIGAINTNFINPHGYHEEEHYSTVYDLAMITRHALNNYPLIKQVAGEVTSRGQGADVFSDTHRSREYVWKTHNLLLTDTDSAYRYAGGVKTGFTTPAGYCLSGSATKDNVDLIAVSCMSTELGRYSDVKNMFDYGFANFEYTTIIEEEIIVDNVELKGAMLGTDTNLEIVTKDKFQGFFSKGDVENINIVIEYNEDYLDKSKVQNIDENLVYMSDIILLNEEVVKEMIFDEDGNLIEEEETDEITSITNSVMIPVIEKGETVGNINYYLNGELLGTSELISTRNITGRTFSTDFSYYINNFPTLMFSFKAIPYWFLFIGLIIAAFYGVAYINKLKKRRRNSYYKYRRRR